MHTTAMSVSCTVYDDSMMGDDDKPYATLSYANGPGYYDHRTLDDSLDTETERVDLTDFQHLMGRHYLDRFSIDR